MFVSGSGRTLGHLLESISAGEVSGEVVLVAASRECRGAGIGRDAGIETVVHDGRWEAESLEDVLDGAGLGDGGWVILAGYTTLLAIPDSYAGRVVNIHPALLPLHGGEGMYGRHVHRAVLDAGDTESGCTVHLCDGVYDRGEVLAQARCRVEAGVTPESLAARVFGLELDLYPRVIEGLIRGEYDEAVVRAQAAVGGVR